MSTTSKNATALRKLLSSPETPISNPLHKSLVVLFNQEVEEHCLHLYLQVFSLLSTPIQLGDLLDTSSQFGKLFADPVFSPLCLSVLLRISPHSPRAVFSFLQSNASSLVLPDVLVLDLASSAEVRDEALIWLVQTNRLDAMMLELAKQDLPPQLWKCLHYFSAGDSTSKQTVFSLLSKQHLFQHAQSFPVGQQILLNLSRGIHQPLFRELNFADSGLWNHNMDVYAMVLANLACDAELKWPILDLIQQQVREHDFNANSQSGWAVYSNVVANNAELKLRVFTEWENKLALLNNTSDRAALGLVQNLSGCEKVGEILLQEYSEVLVDIVKHRDLAMGVIWNLSSFPALRIRLFSWMEREGLLPVLLNGALQSEKKERLRASLAIAQNFAETPELKVKLKDAFKQSSSVMDQIFQLVEGRVRS